MATSIDTEKLRKAIGRELTASDTVCARQCMGLLATLDRSDSARLGEPAPLAIHWCLAPPSVPMSELGADGHPRRGGFLPEVPLPRRMWAGGKLTFHAPIRVGDRVTCLSRIEDVSLKEGRTGTLCFITLSHRLYTEVGTAIEERQDIVYRAANPAPSADAPKSAPLETPRKSDWSHVLTADPVLLFRYSALTFNGHRIHYDRDYATREEGYPGLVVHGPLQATLLLTLAGDLRGQPKTFDFRGVRPLIGGDDFTINAAVTDAGLDLWTADATGNTTMTASATW